MTKQDILNVIRIRAGEVDIATSRYTDNGLMQRLRHALRDLTVRRVLVVSGLTVYDDPTANTYGITPEPSDDQGILLAYRVVVDVLKEQYRKRQAEGSFGISWSSGLESESSIDAAKQYQRLIERAETEADEILLTITSKLHATRPT